MDKNPPAKAGETGPSPGLGRFHMSQSSWAPTPQLLSPCSRAQQPQLLSPCAAITKACVPRACALQQGRHCSKSKKLVCCFQLKRDLTWMSNATEYVRSDELVLGFTEKRGCQGAPAREGSVSSVFSCVLQHQHHLQSLLSFPESYTATSLFCKG